MEWNDEHNSIKFGEAAQGPCFADQHWKRLAGAGRAVAHGRR